MRSELRVVLRGKWITSIGERVVPAKRLAKDLERVVVKPAAAAASPARASVVSSSAALRSEPTTPSIETSRSAVASTATVDPMPVVRRALVVVGQRLVRRRHPLEHALCLLLVGRILVLRPEGKVHDKG
jgi:hypothetical protein